MILANRSSLNNTRSLLRAFGGLNETYGCTEAEYSTGLNFSARDFPALSTRMPRRKLQELTGLNGIYHLNGLLTVCGRDLVYTPDEDPDRPVRVKNAVADSRKTLVGIGTRVLIFPDKIAFDTADGTAASLGALWEAGEISVTFAPCDAEGKTYEGTAKGTQEPEEPADGQRFLKIADPEKPYAAGSTLEEYSEASGSWTPIPLEYCLVTAEGIGTDFRVWDTVTLTGTGAEEAGQWEELDGDRIVYDAVENRLRLRADPGGGKFYGKLIRNGSSAVWVSLDEEERQEMVLTEAVRVERRVPDLEFLTECDNRVWGCSSRENVIYACKLGDPTNWFSYRGIAADSYAVTVGSDGPFYRGGHLHGVCAVLQGKYPAQIVRLAAVGFPAQLPAVPGCGPERGEEPLRPERDPLLSLAGRGHGMGWEHPRQGLGGAGCGAAVQRESCRGRRTGRPVLPAHRPGGPGAAAGL